MLRRCVGSLFIKAVKHYSYGLNFTLMFDLYLQFTISSIFWVKRGQFSVDGSGNVQSEESLSRSALVSSILNSITSNDSYDKRLRPNYGGDPVNVAVKIIVNHLPSVSEMTMDFTMDITLVQKWRDPRLMWKQNISKIVVTDFDFIKSFWVPDIYFPNEKKATFLYTTVNQTYLHLYKNGGIKKEQRLTITYLCPMNLRDFPMDVQTCNITVESYGYAMDDVVIEWERPLPFKIDEEKVKLPTFELGEVTFEETTFTLNSANLTGVYSRLKCYITFQRILRFYWIQIYQPAIFIVAVSWISFWINRDSAPARVTLGITTVLTMTTLMSTANQQMPKVSYVKAVDVYLVFCYFMVFAALVEYAAVSYSNKKKASYNLAKHKNQEDTITTVVEENEEASPSPTPQISVDQAEGSDMSSVLRKRRKQTVSILVSNQFVLTFPCQKCRHKECSKINFVKLRPKNSRLKCIVPCNERLRLLSGKVDKYSRIFFPLVFALFNLIYWLYYMVIVKHSEITEEVEVQE